jgi:hypothetical protein
MSAFIPATLPGRQATAPGTSAVTGPPMVLSLRDPHPAGRGSPVAADRPKVT